jgi:hypothetical protein
LTQINPTSDKEKTEHLETLASIQSNPVPSTAAAGILRFATAAAELAN